MDSLGANRSMDTFSLQDILIFISYTAYYTKRIYVGIKCDCFVHSRHIMSLVAISVRVTAIPVYAHCSYCIDMPTLEMCFCLETNTEGYQYERWHNRGVQ